MDSKIMMGDEVGGGRRELLCPGCEGGNLHHADVHVFDCAEDAEVVKRISVEHGADEAGYPALGSAKVSMSLVPNDSNSGNPSSQRNGITIMFVCENCSAAPVLEIAQHKGATLVGWARGGTS
jgi:hypothetical protein